MDQKEIRIVILHRNRLFRESLALILAQQEAISVVCTAPGFDQTDGELTSLRPDLFLLDFGVRGRDGLDDARQVRAISSECKILMIDVPDIEADVLACIEVGGVSGYLTKEGSIGDLINNIKAIMRDETLCSPRIASQAFSRIARLAHQVNESWSVHSPHLTCREMEIVKSIEEGLSNKEIAVRLHIEVSTVKNHVHNILEKLQLQDRRSAVQYLKEHGLSGSRL